MRINSTETSENFTEYILGHGDAKPNVHCLEFVSVPLLEWQIRSV